MAITRAQQAKQMLKQGGRTGFFTAGLAAGDDISPGTSTSGVGGKGRQDPMGGRMDFTAAEIRAADPIGYGGGLTGPSFRSGDDTPQSTVIIPKKKPPITKENYQKPRKFVTPTIAFADLIGSKISGSKLAMLNNAIQRNNYLATLTPEEQVEALQDLAAIGIGTTNPMGIDRNIERGMEDRGFLGTGIGGNQFITDPDFGGPEAKAVLGQGYQDYLDRNKTEDTDRGDEIQDPCKGPNPPAYCFTGIRSAEKEPEEKIEETFAPNLRLLAGGGMAEKAPYEGGIMDLESARQMYGLGKLVKKVTKSVKKIAKSPIGKAAILGAIGFGIPGVQSGFFSKGLSGTKFGIGFKNFFMGEPLGFKTALDSVARGPNLLERLGIGKTALGIAGISALSGLMTKKDEDDDEEQNMGADLPFPVDYYLSGQYAPNIRLAAEGGLMRTGYQEGSKEPVAKKTMPLLDMGGMEKDYREEGGFVPIGRMEKADDVPARLSKNEFVFTADAVRNAGDGDVDLGAEKMYNMMKNLEAGGDVSEESQGMDGARKMFQTSQRLEEVL